MAMTAWSAKVWSSVTCLSEKGSTRVCRSMITPSVTSSRNSGTLKIVRTPSSRALALPSGNSSVAA